MQQPSSTATFHKIDTNTEWNPDADDCDTLVQFHFEYLLTLIYVLGDRFQSWTHDKWNLLAMSCLKTMGAMLCCWRRWPIVQVKCIKCLCLFHLMFCRLYLEDSRRFLLSAKFFEKAFYISSHEDFPCYPNLPKRGIIATLKYIIYARDSSFYLEQTAKGFWISVVLNTLSLLRLWSWSILLLYRVNSTGSAGQNQPCI